MSTKTKDRLVSLDTYRGLVLALLILEATNYDWVHTVAGAYPESGFWKFMEHHFSHVTWAGAGLWDMIQPSFMFMVGVAMAYSFGKRQHAREPRGRMWLHVVWRAAVLVLLGVFLRSGGYEQTQWTFEDVISQIGLGYIFLFLLWDRGFKVQIGAALGILLAYWALFAFSPVGEAITPEWVDDPAEYSFGGFAAHWNLNANPAHRFDVWFLNLFPRAEPFEFHPEGYNTLNFIPSLAIMIFGLCCGELLRLKDVAAKRKLKVFYIAGAVGIALGIGLHATGLCPLVKKTWTPGFTLFSGGICVASLGLLYWLIDLKGAKGWTFPFVVMGMNSIALYCMLWLIPGWINGTLQTHLGEDYAGFAGAAFGPLLQNLIVGVFLWLICYWMYRRRLFLRI